MIEKEQDGKIAILTLNNPPVNAICAELLESLDEKIQQIKEDKETRVVIITGKGKSFVAGADISEMKNMAPQEAYEFSRKGQKIFDKLSNLSIPIIAAVNGFALGGGLELAMSCDFIISSDKAKYGEPEVSLGVIPGFGGTQRLSRKIGEDNAKELIFTGRRIESEEAKEIGLVNHVVGASELMNFSKDLAEKIISNGPLAVEYSKKAIVKGVDLTLKEGLELEAEQFKKCFETEDQDEGMDAFLNKREPKFKRK